MDFDPYTYVGTQVLINLEDIRDAGQLKVFERQMVAQRLSEDFPVVDLTAQGYCQIHHHIFQDIYHWAGKIRSIDISKDKSYFCRADFIPVELGKRFVSIQNEDGLRGMSAEIFAARAADHVSEINAIHPFRDGNGRTLRLLLEVLAAQAGHTVDIARIAPAQWNEASREVSPAVI